MKRSRRASFLELLERRFLLASDWQNACNPLDSSGDGLVAPLDALLLINRLNDEGPGPLGTPTATQPPPFFDVNADGLLAPIDALLIINALNEVPSQPFFQFQGGLTHDSAPSGTTNSDSLTYDARLSGTLTAVLGLSRLEARVDGGPLRSLEHACGRFELDPGLARDGSDDGPHLVRITGVDPYHRRAEYDIAFVLDTTPPEISLALAPASDSGISGDQRTSLNPVELRGVTSAETPIELLRAGQFLQSTTIREDGSFTFPQVQLAQGSSEYTARGFDLAGNAASAHANVVLDRCGILGSFSGWIAGEQGGAVEGRGTVEPDECGAVLTEGNSFVVTLERTFTIQPDTPPIQFEWHDLSFDTLDSGAMRDAFEVALVDRDGNSLLPSFAPGKEAFLNLAEGLPIATSPAVIVAHQVVTIDLSEIPAATEATLKFRLINNDRDYRTSVRVAPFEMPAASGGTPATGGRVADSRRPSAATGDVATFLNFPIEIDAQQRPASITALAVVESDESPSLQLVASLPRALVPAGTRLLIAGTASLVGPQLESTARVEQVLVNGQAVAALDLAGSFYRPYDVLPGENTIEITALDSLGRAANVTLSVFGAPPDSLNPLAELRLLANGPLVEHGRTSWDHANSVVQAEMWVENLAQSVWQEPLWIGVRNLSDPSVRVLGADFRAANELWLFDVSSRIGESLPPGESVAARTLAFYNPASRPFQYELTLLSALNQPPVLTTAPDVEAVAERNYAFDFGASDPDGDSLSFTVAEGPLGLTIDNETGRVEWSPTASDSGTHPVSLVVRDERGATTELRYLLHVVAASSNRPPVITSDPNVIGHVATPYRYSVAAQDADGDSLTYRMRDATPRSISIANASFETQIVGEGGNTVGILSDWTISGGAGAGAFNPGPTSYPGGNVADGKNVAFSNGPTIAQTLTERLEVGVTYRLQVAVGDRQETNLPDFEAQLWAGGLLLAASNQPRPANGQFVDVEVNYAPPVDHPALGQPLEIRLVAAGIQVNWDHVRLTATDNSRPAGMTLNAATGELSWTPIAAQVGTHFVRVEVEDGRGGSAQQEFAIRVEPEAGNHPPMIVSQPDTTVVFPPLRTIDFEGFAGMPFRDSVVPPEARLSDQYLATHGATFRSASGVPYVSFIALGANHAHSGVNGIGGMGTATTIDYATPIVVEFFVAGDNTRPLSMDFVSLKVDQQGTGGTVHLDGLGLDGTLLERVSAIDLNGPTLTLTKPGIHSVIIHGTSTTAFDDLTFGEDRPVHSYHYDLRAIDGDHDPLSYQLLAAPLGMTFDGATGRVDWQIARAVVGSHPVELQVADGRGGVATQSFEVHVLQQLSGQIRGTLFDDRNRDGLFNADEPGLADGVLYLDANLNGQHDEGERVTHSDIDGVYQFSDLAPGIYSVAVEGRATAEVTAPADGRYEVTVASGGIVEPLDFGLHFLGETLNRSPAFVSTPSASAIVDRAYRYLVAARDPDGDALRFDLPLHPEGMTVDQRTGRLGWQPTADQRGNHDVILRVRDGRGGVALQAFQVEVTANTAPVFTALPATDAVESMPYEFRLRAQDAERDALIFDLDQGPHGLRIDQATGILRWTPAPAQVGAHTVTARVSDVHGAVANVSFVLTVVSSAPNHDPIIRSTPRTEIRLGGTYLYAVDVVEPDNDPISLILASVPPGMAVRPGTQLLEWVPAAEQTGDHDIEVRVVDGRGGEAIQSYRLRVTTASRNQPPTIVSSPRQSVVVNHPYDSPLRAADPDGDPLIWTLSHGPRGMSLDPDLGVLRWTPAVDQIGLHEVAVQVTDGQGASASQQFSVTVRAMNLPPIIASTPPTRASAGQDYAYAVVARDADNDPLQFSLSDSPTGMTIDSATGLIRWTPTTSQIGRSLVVVRTRDGQGGQATQRYEIDVAATAQNLPPRVTNTAPRVAQADVGYLHDVEAQDPEGERLVFSLVAPPVGMTIDPDTGAIQWTPTVAQAGERRVTVLVTDAAGNQGHQSYAVLVQVGNRAPEIQSTGPATTLAGQVYRYDVRAFDPDGNPLAFELPIAPLGMAIDPLGRITWRSTTSDIGPHAVRVRVTDALGASVFEDFTVTVAADTRPPEVFLTISSARAHVGETITALLSAWDNVEVVARELTFNHVPLAIDAEGRAAWAATQAGVFNLVGQARDAAGNTRTATIQLTVIDPSDLDAPLVEIASPAGDQVIERPVEVRGTASDAKLLSYTLSLAPQGSSAFVELARGTNPVVDGVLGQIDPTLLLNDTYVLRLEAVDAGGNSSIVDHVVHVAGQLKLGNFRLTFTDLTVPVFGVPISVTRSYDTLLSGQASDLGFGWRLDYRDTRLRTSVAPSRLESYGVFNPLRVGSRVYITLPGGERQGFTFRPQLAAGFRGGFLGIFEPRFVPDAGVKSSLSVVPADLRVNAAGELADYGTGIPYNPASGLFGRSYVLTTKEGLAYDIDALTGQLKTLRDTGNNTLTFSDTGVTGPDGIHIDFERDSRGRITAVVDPAGHRIEYQYDSAGDLATVTDRTGNVTQFFYRSTPAHYLERAVDPLGRTGVRVEYDDHGRLRQLTDALGHATLWSVDLAHLTSTVTDALGNKFAEEYDARGNVVRRVDALGNITKSTYDVENNLVSRIDPLGRLTTFTYNNRGDALTQTDPLGNTTISTYEAFTYGTTLLAALRGQAAAPFTRIRSSTDALGNTALFDYNELGNPTSTQDPAGNVTRLEYDKPHRPPVALTDPLGNVTRFEYRNGLLVRQVDALGNATVLTYDPTGNRLSSTRSRTLANGSVRDVVERTTYDAEGRPLATTDAAGGVTRHEYDAAGNEIARIDPLGRRTEYRYDQRNMLVETILPDATPDNLSDNPRTRTEFDAAGREFARIDELGRRTEFQYDAAGRQVKVIQPDDTPANPLDNPVAQTEYDAAGQVTARIDELNQRTEFQYNPLGMETSRRDALGHVATTRFDRAGVASDQTDSLGFTTSFAHDALRRLTQTTHPDGTTSTVTFDANGRVIARSDQLQRTTRYEYDAVGQLITTIDAAGHATTFRYDEVGYLIETRMTVTAVDGSTSIRITKSEYDDLGRVIATTDADGGVTRTEYDLAGNRTAIIDALGRRTEFQYDQRHRLVATIYPDATPQDPTDNPRTRREYDGAGRLIEQLDELGRRTSYTYDARDQLVQTIYPDGTSTRVEYDAKGRVAAQIDERGHRIEFAYDELDRRTTRRDALGNTVRWTYDARGRRISETDSLGHTTQFTYDPMGRRTETRYADGAVARALYDAAGQLVESLDELGRSTRYEYDAVGRATATIDPLGQRTEYVYNEVGELLRWTDANLRATRYEYNQRGLRTATLLPPLSGEPDFRFSTQYDPVGNPIETLDYNGQAIVYQYDERNRLIAKRFPSGDSVSFAYTAAGELAAETGAQGTIRYSYDERGRRLARLEPDGAAVHYVYDASGNPTSVTTVVGQTTLATLLTYDELNRLQTVTDPRQGTTRYAYDANHNQVRAELPNAVIQTRQYDARNRLIALEDAASLGVIQRLLYTLGPTGRRDAVVEATGRRIEYAYDPLDRLVSESITDAVFGDRTFDYTYDAVGNRLTRRDSAEGLTTYAYDAHDRLLTETIEGNVTAYSYDRNGNLRSRISATDRVFYAWDDENRLIAADTDGDGHDDVQMKYDPSGERVGQVSQGQETRFLLDTVRPLAEVLVEYRPSGLVIASYVLGQERISQERGGVQSFYHRDGSGSTRALSALDATVTDQYLYDAFGRLLAQQGATTNSYYFAGQSRDSELGWDFLRARFYDSEIGRFASRDPIWGMSKSSLEAYAYAASDPINKVDPSGLSFFSLQDVATANAVFGALTGGITGYQAGGWKGAIFGAVTGGLMGYGTMSVVRGAALLGAARLGVSVGVSIQASQSAFNAACFAANVAVFITTKDDAERFASAMGLLFYAAGYSLPRFLGGTKAPTGGAEPEYTFVGGYGDDVQQLGQLIARQTRSDIVASRPGRMFDEQNFVIRADQQHISILNMQHASSVESVLTHIHFSRENTKLLIFSRNQLTPEVHHQIRTYGGRETPGGKLSSIQIWVKDGNGFQLFDEFTQVFSRLPSLPFDKRLSPLPRPAPSRPQGPETPPADD